MPRFLFFVGVLLCLLSGVSQAQNEFVRRYATTANGALVMTGNTLGLAKGSNTNLPGTEHSIGIYTSLNPSLSAVGWPLATYGPTTADYTQNGSTARMLMPSGSKVRYAELIWGGTLVANGQTLTASDVNNSVTFSRVSDGAATVFLSSQAFSPDTATRLEDGGYYVRSANVTNFVRQNGSGFYACQGVRSTLSATENVANSAGWSLVVIYENDSLPARNMTIFVGATRVNSSNSNVNVVRGFCTAPFGQANLKSRLAVSALEGDAVLTGDQFQFGSTSTLTSANAVGAAGNPQTNFFGGQVNTGYDGQNAQNGTLDTTGTAGSRNHTVGTPGAMSSGGRQGWDITNIDVSAQMQPNQNAAYFRGTSAGDTYVITSAALQLDVGAPRFPINVKQVDKTVTFVGDVLTYTVTLDNTTGTADALNTIFYDDVPVGTSFVPGSLTVDGVSRPGADPANGVPVGTVAQGGSKVVSFKVNVNSVPPPPAPPNFKNIARWTYEFQSCSFESVAFEQLSTNEVITTTARLEPVKSVTGPNAAPLANDVLTWTMSIPNTGTASTSGATLVDPIPSGTTYVAGTTRLNGTLISDVGGAFPFASARPINSPTGASGVIKAGETATVTFQTRVNSPAPSRVSNLATVDADGNGTQPAQQFGVSIPAISADLGVLITDGKTSIAAGINNSYTVTVSNNGPTAVGAFNLFLNIPPAFKNPVITPSRGTYDVATGDWNKGNGADVFTGQTVTFTVTGRVDPALIDPLTLSAQVAPPAGVGDTNSANNSSSDTDTVDRVADLALTKTDNRTSFARGESVAYNITVTNNGPAAITELTITDPLPSALLNPLYVPTQGTVNPSTGQITGIDLMPGEKLTLTITVDVSATASGTVTNTATVSVPADITDPDSTNNSATDTTTVGYSVSGTVYLDNNTSFARDPNENGYDGQNATAPLWVKIRTGSGNALAATQVAADGTFTLSYVTSGNYTLFLDTNGTLTDRTTTIPSGYVVTQTGSAPGERAISLSSTLPSQDFGLYAGSRISGFVFRDNAQPTGTANNGIKEAGEIGVGSVRIQLRSADLQTLYGEAYTDTVGAYSIVVPSAAAGQSIRLVKTNPASYISTGASRGTLPSAGYSYDRNADTISATPVLATSYTDVNFGIVPDNTLSNDGNKVVARGGTVTYPHVFTAQSGGNVTFSLTNTASPANTGWSALLYIDSDGDGEIDPGETQPTGAQNVVAGQSIALVVKVFAPADGAQNATLNTQVGAAFSYTNASPALGQTISRTDITTLTGQSGLVLVKAVDKATAKSGETIAYEITYTNNTTDTLSKVVVNDMTPAFTKFLDASFDTLPLNLTACTVTKPAVGAKGALKWTFTGTLAPGQSGKVRFRVTVE